MATHDDLLQQITHLAATSADATTLMQRIADHVHSQMPRYNSISFRFIDEANPGVLVLGPYTGSFTPQKRLAFGQGLCGTAAATEKTVVVNNVEADARYLRASSMVKSEIVVPILVKGRFAALIDIQSYFVDTFKAPDDQSFVESCARIVAKFIEGRLTKA
ncbi:MAG TPA: GAF domain-containing protein [Candidatus Angelobacter sp.]|nr:GAF domain-containing protein [Candidatus Angelobacter sp.]